METALTEITLVVFTTVAPAGMLAYAFLAVSILAQRDAARACAIAHWLVVPLVLAAVGFVASATHLGTPANALYVASGIGRSPLSNEVAAAVVFLALAGSHWIASFADSSRITVRRVWLAVAALSALVATWFISRAYSVATISTWDTPAATATLWANGLSAAPAVAALTMMFAKEVPGRRCLVAATALSGVAAVADVTLLASIVGGLGQIQTVAHNAAALVPHFGLVIVLYAAFEAGACALLAFSAFQTKDADYSRKERSAFMARFVLAVVLVLLASFAVRFEFYSMYMTVGL